MYKRKESVKKYEREHLTNRGMREKRKNMKIKTKKMFLCMLLAVITLVSVQPTAVMAKPAVPELIQYTPIVLVKEITDCTTSMPVYVYDDTTLYIKKGNKTIFQRYYQKKGVKNVKIKKQKGGSRLKFYLVAKVSGKKGDTVTRNVTKLPIVAPEKLDASIPKPLILKTITSKTSSISVTGHKGSTLVIKNEKKILGTVKYKKSGEQKITFPAQEKGTLYFYVKIGNKRSEVVSRKIKDVTAPKAPKLKAEDWRLLVKGEMGTKVYFKGADGWRCLGFVLDKGWNPFLAGVHFYDTECEYYEVYLKDASGNKSKKVRIKNPNPGLPPQVM